MKILLPKSGWGLPGLGGRWCVLDDVVLGFLEDLAFTLHCIIVSLLVFSFSLSPALPLFLSLSLLSFLLLAIHI